MNNFYNPFLFYIFIKKFFIYTFLYILLIYKKKLKCVLQNEYIQTNKK